MKNEKSVNIVIQVNDMDIGRNIRVFRERAGLMQTETVRKLQISGIDISVYSYNRIEKGTQNPTVSCLLALCNLFGCDMNDLFGFKK